MITLRKKVLKWGNSAGIYVPREHIGKWASVQISEEPKLSESYVYGAAISMECYGYALFKPDSFAPQLHSPAGLKGFNTADYGGEKIKIMLPEDIILELLKNPASQIRMILGIAVMLRKYKASIDFGYLIDKAKEAGKVEFLGYILETCLRIFSKRGVRKDLQDGLQQAIKKAMAAKAPGAKIRFPSPELERIYWRTKNREAVEATRRDSLIKKWNLAYMPKEKEFEEAFSLYSVD